MSTALLTRLPQHWHQKFPPKRRCILETEHAPPPVRLTIVQLTETRLKDMTAQLKKTQQFHPHLWPIVVASVFEPISRRRPRMSIAASKTFVHTWAVRFPQPSYQSTLKKGVMDKHTTFNTLYNTASTNARQMLNGKVITGTKNVPYRVITRMHKDKAIKQGAILLTFALWH